MIILKVFPLDYLSIILLFHKCVKFFLAETLIKMIKLCTPVIYHSVIAMAIAYIAQVNVEPC